ncbi:hypothetical protein JXA88_03060 [Candidatus Fermentibacteria bacterium]|nr:hypothetical protein [Candidatus Fermentibacteria bacterium]
MPDANRMTGASTPGLRPGREWSVVVLMMLMSAALSFRVFFPHLRDIVIFDESYYIDKGQRLLHGELPVLAENPLVAAFWAVLSLPFRESPFWMVYAYGLGRFVAFTFLWAGSYAVAQSLRRIVHPLASLGFLLVTPSLWGLLDNSTDGLFAALSAVALARLLVFLREGRLASGLQASVLLGLAALARNDGLVLLVVAVFLTLLLWRRETGRLQRAGAILLPASGIVAAYIAIQALASGSLNLGIARRSYDAFEQGEGVVYADSYQGRNSYVEGYDAARALYGTPQENRYSIARAIFRNPPAFGRRLMIEMGQAPAQATAVYGRGLHGVGAVLFFLALRGLVALWGRREKATALVLVLWCSHLLLYGLTFYREGYFLLVYAPVFWLASAGAAALFDGQRARREMFCTIGALGMLILYGVGSSNLPLWGPGAVFLLGALLAWGLLSGRTTGSSPQTRALLGVGAVLLVFSLQVHLSRPARLGVPGFPQVGTHADEMAARFLAETQREGTPVASYTMAPVTLARMSYMAPHIDGRWIASREDFMEWVAQRDVHVFYVDRNLRVCEPGLWEIMQSLIGTHLRIGFHAEDDYETVDVLFH